MVMEAAATSLYDVGHIWDGAERLRADADIMRSINRQNCELHTSYHNTLFDTILHHLGSPLCKI